ncbi:enoyl-CoA hydratase/isomerase family protein [Neobacillus niacini]|uniref:enoyl-CoA hydratase/isomerase family protein n=1 Tax=Neobacillus niacini TaxID=86668 RepID=UPI0021CB966C|nr:enoyl-CoA hydratase/isomerase family protein [Neobacillus niacini]MCM3766262.1 enoyl-CoA hydratase/isomerase family protein [Neobacillus niacini]
MENDVVYYEKNGEASWVYLNKPESMNALSKGVLSKFIEILTILEKDKGTKVVVITGTGKAFCAGADLKEIMEELKDKEVDEPGFFDYGRVFFQKLYSFPKPIIAALNGMTLAGGLEIALTADIIIASESAKIGDAHANFGVLPGGGSSIKLARKIGENRAKYLLLSGDFISAKEMKEYGLVHKVVKESDLIDEVNGIANKLAKKSPLVLEKMKKLVSNGYEQPFNVALENEMSTLQAHLRSYDLKEGLSAFNEKRNPNFKGF